MTVLHEKWRPQNLDEVAGQDHLIESLRDVLANQRSHAFLFVGPSGCGKTTLARIAAAELGCQPNDIREVDAASNTGVDDMREVTESLRYKPFGASASRGILIDEAHRLSGNAWDSLLKSMEEPPEWAFWFLCTTNVDKVPKTALTRCLRFDVRPLTWQTILSHVLRPIAEAEGLAIPDPVLGLCARAADGSPRQALANLTLCIGATDEQSAQLLLQGTADNASAVDLARLLARGAKWGDMLEVIKRMKDDNPETVRRIICAYMTTAILGAKAGPTAPLPVNFMAVLEAFEKPFYGADNMAPVLLACARLVPA